MLSKVQIVCLHKRAARQCEMKRKKCANRTNRGAGLMAVIILASLPYSSALSLPSGDPAPGRSPGPPAVDFQGDLQNSRRPKHDLGTDVDAPLDADVYDETTTNEYETTTAGDTLNGGDGAIGDACAYARIPSDSGDIVTLSESDSDVNLTISHSVFDAGELVRGVVYDGK